MVTPPPRCKQGTFTSKQLTVFKREVGCILGSNQIGPAVYYGDREADIAMTELFGGFSADFYRRYQQIWPLDDGYPVRKHLYNLYHILNHFNMFGGSYESQAEGICSRLLSEI